MTESETPIPEDEPVNVDGPPYLLRPHRSRETLRFESARELAEWLVQEEEAWASVMQIDHRPNFAGNVVQHVQRTHHQLQGHLQEYLNGDNDARGPIRSLLQQIQDGVVPISATPWISTALRLADTDPEAALAMLVVAADPQHANPKAIHSQPQALMSFVRGIANGLAVHLSEGHVAQEETLSRLRKRWDDRFRQTHHKEETATKKLQRQSVRQERIEKAALSAFKHVRDDWKASYDQTLKEHQESMAEMEQAFSTKMQLQASECFWKDKERENRNRAETAQTRFYKVAGGGLAAYLVFCGLMAWVFGDKLLTFSPFSTAVFLVPLGLFIWVLRFFSQDHRTNASLADDAHERHNMVLAFKALEYEDHIPPEERLIVLQALFRPHGRPPEDTVPVPVWDAFIRRIDPGRGPGS